MKKAPYIEIENPDELMAIAGEADLFQHIAFQGIDFNEIPDPLLKHKYTDCIFMGCVIPEFMKKAMDSSCFVFPTFDMPFTTYPNCLYDFDSLYAGYDPDVEGSFDICYDTQVYQHYVEAGKQADCISETLARSLHDHSISDALYDFLAGYDEKDVIAVMGGHALSRTDEGYRKVAMISKSLTEKGKLMVSGGGPGAMEATHLGAWMAGRSVEELDDALTMLSVAPSFRDPEWLSSAVRVMRKYPQEKFCSLGVPTWFYGHEPTAAFATHIAKYFDNSVREDGILTIAKGGIIYSPGSAGTLQEIFQDAAQNHYETFGYASPMVFLGEKYYKEEIPVYPLIEDLLARGKYKNLIISITDDADEVISKFI